jgi:hypothetical protein
MKNEEEELKQIPERGADISQINVWDERFYQPKGSSKYYPSVTWILSAYPKGAHFEKWLKEHGLQADEILDAAGRSGAIVHYAIESMIKEGHTMHWEDYGELEYSMIVRFTEWFERAKPRIIAMEERLYSDKLGGYAGTVDLVCMIDGNVWVIDFKTSNHLADQYPMQLASYASAIEGSDLIGGLDVYSTGVLWLKAKTRTDKGWMQGKGWQLKEYSNWQKHFKEFAAVKAVWDIQNPNAKPRNLSYPEKVKLSEVTWI